MPLEPGQEAQRGLKVDSRVAIRAGGTSGPRLCPVTSRRACSIRRSSAADGVEPMPPKGKLPASVVADFRQWITMGAPDPRDGHARSDRPGRPRRPEPRLVVAQAASGASRFPPSSPPLTDWARNPIDAFILARLKETACSPAPEADRRTLIRRLSFDLLGLPPDARGRRTLRRRSIADAYERLVDRLLASPHYGERWARHWMDLVHFAETHGHDQDRIRPQRLAVSRLPDRLVQPRHAVRAVRAGAGGRRCPLSGRAPAGGRPGNAGRRPLG